MGQTEQAAIDDDGRIHDVVQVGYGPVGQTLAALLGRRGHNVVVHERHAGLYALPRAGHIDHEIMRIFQSVGATTAMEADLYRCSRYLWRNQHGQILVDIDWSRDGVSGWASDYLMYQPYVEEALDQAVRACPTVSVHHGWEAQAVRQHADHVEVVLREYRQDSGGTAHGRTKIVRGRYCIGTDGANSIVRAAAGIELDDLGFRENWLVTDFRQKRPLSFDFDNGQMCDPARPYCLFQLGLSHRRFEFMLLPGEDPAQMTSAERVWQLASPYFGPEDADLIRSTVYTFRSAVARQWRDRRVLLAGDSAHLMPPFLGQGMCSGVRDAANLAWKLDLVLTGKADAALLDSYMTERRPHVREIIDQAVALGRISCTIDPREAAERDRLLLSGAMPPPPSFPKLEEGVLAKTPAKNGAVSVVGELGPQGRIGLNGETGRADDLLGTGWQLICAPGNHGDPLAGLSAAARAVMDQLGIHVLPLGDNGAGVVQADDVYRNYFARAGVRALLVRPDFYVYAGVDDRAGLEAALMRLAEQSCLVGNGQGDSVAGATG